MPTPPNRLKLKNRARDFFEFSVDAALFRELGERLVGKPHVALAELVKNAYDADATKVNIRFGNDSIDVIDNGHGMSREDFRNFWMRIGTTNKQETSTSPRLKRRITGSKGIGRLSVQFLGSELELWSVRTGAQGVHAEVDWTAAKEAVDIVKAGAWVTDFDPEQSNAKLKSHGTQISIQKLNQEWTERDLRDLARELWFLRPPIRLKDDVRPRARFDITIEGLGEEETRAFSEVMNAAISNWIAEIRGSLTNGRKGGKANLIVKFRDEEEYTQEYEIPNCAIDEAAFLVRIYKLTQRQPFGVSVEQAREYFRQFGGVHIYDDDFHLPFYGGVEQDWLRLEIDHSHRLMTSHLLPEPLVVQGGLQDLPTLGRVFGVVNVSTSHERAVANAADLKRGRHLNIQLTRDRLISNQAFDNLVYLVRWAFDYYANRSYERRQQKMGASEVLPPVSNLFDSLKGELELLRESIPAKFRPKVASVLKTLEHAQDVELKREESLANEKVLLGALATAGMGALALEHELAKEIVALRSALTALRDRHGPIAASDMSQVVEKIKSWIDRASGARNLFSPLMNRTDRERRTRMSVKKVVRQIRNNLSLLLRNIDVHVDGIASDLRFPPATLAAWNAILQNIFVNAVNAMIDSPVRLIQCDSEVDAKAQTARLIISDKGVGADLADSEELFKPFVRRLELPKDREALGLGGVGLGLTIVRSVASAVGCKVKFIEPKQGMRTSLELSWSIRDD